MFRFSRLQKLHLLTFSQTIIHSISLCKMHGEVTTLWGYHKCRPVDDFCLNLGYFSLMECTGWQFCYLGYRKETFWEWKVNLEPAEQEFLRFTDPRVKAAILETHQVKNCETVVLSLGIILGSPQPPISFIIQMNRRIIHHSPTQSRLLCMLSLIVFISWLVKTILSS